jgi:cytochrome c-type biogenesis protein CcmH/NrfF
VLAGAAALGHLAPALLLAATAALALPAAAAPPESAPSAAEQAPTVYAANPEARPSSEPLAASQNWSRELERSLMSPYCPGRSLIECPSQKAVELRLWIQAQEKAGVPRAEVEARLFEEWGDQLLHAPRASGWGLWAYLVPGFAMFAGGVLVLSFLHRQGGASATREPPAPDPELAREIDRELGAP